MANAFELSGIIKKYKDFTLGPLNLELKQGSVMGYVGNNGAGKTTTIYLLSGIILADEGQIKLFGKEIKGGNIDWRHNLGYVGEAGAFYENWNVGKNLKFISEFYPKWSFEFMQQLISRLDLDLNKKVSTLSTGNRMKLKLISALSYKPNLLLLDEPSSGLDPLVRAEFADILREYMEDEQNSILYSTHIISDISRLADEFTFLRDGKIIFKQNREDLQSSWRQIFIKSPDMPQLMNAIQVSGSQNNFSIITDNYQELMSEIKEKGYQVENDSIMSLEDITLEILKRGKNVPLS